MFYNHSDYKHVARNHGEAYRLWFRPRVFYSRTTQGYNDFYGEADYRELFSGEKWNIPARIALNPQRSEWSKVGIEEKRDLRVHISTETLRVGVKNQDGSRSPIPTPKVGWVIIVEDDPYVITDITPQDYWGSGESDYHTLVLWALKARKQTGTKIKVKVEQPPVEDVYKAVYAT